MWRSFTIVLFLGFHPIGVFATEVCKDKFSGTSDPSVVAARLLGRMISKDKVTEHLEYLTGKKAILFDHKLTDRKRPANKEIARAYLVGFLQSLGLEVTQERFYNGINFIAEIEGTEQPDEVFEVTAHYDTAGEDVPGADDNGSGLATVLEIARIFSRHPPKRTLRITLMDLEETGGDGSEFHAKALTKEFPNDGQKKFIASLVIDMIGYNPSGDNQKVVLEVGKESQYGPKSFGWGNHNYDRDEPKVDTAAAYALSLECASTACYQFLRFAQNKVRDSRLRLTVDIDNAKPNSGDHGSYWERGLPALFLAAPFSYPYVNPHNHKSTDTMANINWDYFMSVMGLAVEITAKVTNASPLGDDVNDAEVMDPVIAQENTAVVLTPEIIKELQPLPESYTYAKDSKPVPDSLKNLVELTFREYAYRSFLILEKDGTRADVGYLQYNLHIETIYVPQEAVTASLIARFVKEGRPILIKNSSRPTLGGEVKRLANWYVDNVPSKRIDLQNFDVPPPDGYRYFQSQPDMEKDEKKTKKKGSKKESSWIKETLGNLFGVAQIRD